MPSRSRERAATSRTIDAQLAAEKAAEVPHELACQQAADVAVGAVGQHQRGDHVDRDALLADQPADLTQRPAQQLGGIAVRSVCVVVAAGRSSARISARADRPPR